MYEMNSSMREMARGKLHNGQLHITTRVQDAYGIYTTAECPLTKTSGTYSHPVLSTKVRLNCLLNSITSFQSGSHPVLSIKVN